MPLTNNMMGESMGIGRRSVTTCYHTTSAARAASILEGGFLDTFEDQPQFGERTDVYLCEQSLADGCGLPGLPRVWLMSDM